MVGEVGVHEYHEVSLAEFDAVLIGGAQPQLAWPLENVLG